MVAQWYGFNPPFIGGTQTVLTRQEDVRLITNDLLQLILTVPGERVHRPTFGTILRSSVFEPFDNITVLQIRDDILNAISREEPRVTDVIVYLQGDKDEQVLRVKVTCVLTFDPNVKLELETAVSAPGVSA